MLIAWCATLLLAAPFAEADLLGEWSLQGQPFMRLEAGGRGSMEGESFRWSTGGGRLKLVSAEGEAEQFGFQLEGDRLSLNMEGAVLILERSGPAKAAPESPATKAAPPSGPAETKNNAGAPSTQDPLSQLLLSSPWCYFSYSGGTTRTERVQYAANGTWSSGSNRETNWSGQNGSYYGQNSGGHGGRWAVKGGQLYVSAPPQIPDLVPVPLTVTRNSNGYPIVTAAGKEYAQCN